MPTMKPVRLTAHLTFFLPKTWMSVVAMRWAPPLSSSSLPSMAPNETTMARPPSVAPRPFSMVGTMLPMGSPSQNARMPATSSRDRKLLSFTLTIRKNSSTMPAARMNNGMRYQLLCKHSEGKSVLRPIVVECAFAVGALIRVCTKVVA